jgi:hypothetical protein
LIEADFPENLGISESFDGAGCQAGVVELITVCIGRDLSL